jgi:TonB family protein
MSAARARKILLAALAISLLVHLLLAGYIRWPNILRPSEERVAKVRIITVARRTPPPPPTPPPAPVPTPAATPRVRASIAPPRTVSHTPKGAVPPPKSIGPGVSARTPLPLTPAPTPLATSSPSSCVHNTSDPSVSATPGVGEIPADVRAAKISGLAAIRVALDAQGRVIDASVAQSTGNSGLDSVAMQMARTATYTPRYVDCKAVAGNYVFKVDFRAW